MQTTKTPLRNHQQGMSLIVAMVMVMLMTMVAVSSMRTSILELKVANSLMQKTTAMNQAEQSLANAEQDIDAMVADPDACGFGANNGHYMSLDNLSAKSLGGIDWSGFYKISNSYGNYINEYMGAKDVPGGTITIASDGAIIGGQVHSFRLTSKGNGAKRAVRLVQSIYVTEGAP